MLGKLFGTDGVRGIANEALTCELAMSIGRGTATCLGKNNSKKLKVLIGKDTRISGDMLENALSAGLCSVGADVVLLGVVPTPAVAYLVKKYNADAGIMISASHNPAEYNGIKIFSGEGYKIPDEYEAEIEDFVLNKKDAPLKTGAEVGRITFCNNAQNDYAEYILSTTEVGDRSLKILIDCANGSASATAEKIFGKLSSYCTFIGNTPDGTNINDGCGSLHIERLKQQVLDGGFDLAVAFDGDADRIMALDEKGNIIDGDKLMAIFANYYKEKNELDNDTLVATVMSNFGLFKFAEKLGIVCKKTKVGDRFVLEEMLKSGDVLGGEQSGHIILKKYATTGDGELSAVKLIEVLNRAHKPLSELASVMDTYPQVLINVTVSNDAKSRYETDEIIKKSVMENEKRLEGDGRVLVRASGTEPLIRVMAEGLDEDLVKDCAEKIAQVIKERLS